MTQVVARVPEALLRAVDELVARGVVESRSAAVRVALESLVDGRRRAGVGAAIVDGYRRRPQTDDEVGWADEATRQMVGEEPW
jgi:Arc/MetJ-type ribon-helix-helix transcriptional regulator